MSEEFPDVWEQIRPGVYQRVDADGIVLERLVRPGEIIHARRRSLRMSMQELGDRIGVSKSTISRYESGEIEKMPVSFLGPIAKALNVSPLYLLGAEYPPDELDQGTTLSYETVPVPTIADRTFSYEKTEIDLLVEKYTAAPEHIKQAIRTMLQMG